MAENLIGPEMLVRSRQSMRMTRNIVRYGVDTIPVGLSQHVSLMLGEGPTMPQALTVIEYMCNVAGIADMRDFNSQAGGLLKDQDTHNAAGIAWTEGSLATELWHYDTCGSHAFEFGEEITKELSRTDIEDIRLSEIQMPYGSIYMRFSAWEGKTFDGTEIDGFFVSMKAENEYDITPVPKSMLPIGGARISFIPSFKMAGADEELITKVIERGCDDVERLNVKEFEKESEYVSGDEVAAYRKEKDALNLLTREWMKLIINGLLMIDTKEMAENQWQSEAPAELAEKASSGKAGAKKAEKKLRALGYTRLKRIEIPKGMRIDEGHGTASGTVRPHWRRGHWRRQPYGPGLTKYRRIRVRPAIVGAKSGKKTGEEGGSRHYKV